MVVEIGELESELDSVQQPDSAFDSDAAEEPESDAAEEPESEEIKPHWIVQEFSPSLEQDYLQDLLSRESGRMVATLFLITSMTCVLLTTSFALRPGLYRPGPVFLTAFMQVWAMCVVALYFLSQRGYSKAS
jgi:hypothetical protein